jgi:hypothetical protein
MAEEPRFRIDFVTGYIRIEQADRMDADGWLRHYSRRIEHADNGMIRSVGEWEQIGAAMKFV